MKVVVTDYEFEHAEVERALVEGAGFDFYEYQIKDPDELIPIVKDADAIMTQYSDVNEKVIDSLEHCRMIIRYGIGYNNIDVDAATKRGIIVCNVPDYSVEEVSDHTVAMILALARKLKNVDGALQNGSWGYRNALPLKRFADSTVGFVGFGRIAQAVARKLAGFRVKTLAYDPYMKPEVIESFGAVPASLETVLKESDYVSIHSPLTKGTHHMIGKNELALMKPTACIVNTARGGVLDEEALIEALEAGKLGGLGLDSYEVEPISSDSPFLHRDNVIVTSHAAWYSETAIADLQRKTAEEVVNVLQGNMPFSCVNKSVL